MTDWQKDVREFHKKYAHPIGRSPRYMDWERLRVRIDWMNEELTELAEASDLTGQVDALVDLIYFALGAAVEMGVDLEPVWKLVQKANMAKEGGKRREDGKVQKHEDWEGPEDAIARELSRQGKRKCKS